MVKADVLGLAIAWKQIVYFRPQSLLKNSEQSFFEKNASLIVFSNVEDLF